MKPDIFIQDHGTLVQFLPISPAGERWLEESLDPDCHRLGASFMVEHRYATDIILGIINDTDLVTN